MIRLEHDVRLIDLRLVLIADAKARGIEAIRQDRANYDLPPGDPRAASLTRAVVFGAPEAVLMNLPQLTEDQPVHRISGFRGTAHRPAEPPGQRRDPCGAGLYA